MGATGLLRGRDLERGRLRDLEVVLLLEVAGREGRAPTDRGVGLAGTLFTLSGHRGFHA